MAQIFKLGFSCLTVSLNTRIALQTPNVDTLDYLVAYYKTDICNFGSSAFMKLIDTLAHWFKGEKQPTDLAVEFMQVFHDSSGGLAFFDLVYAHFERYDEWNRAHKDSRFESDVKFIAQCTATSLTSPELLNLFTQRIDAYLYISCRVREYTQMIQSHHERARELETTLIRAIGELLKVSHGAEPNFGVRKSDLVKRIHVRRFLTLITEVSDLQSLFMFFGICKLCFQSDSQTVHADRLSWPSVLSRIKCWKISLEECVKNYIHCRQAFDSNPLDESDFMHLVRMMHPSKSSTVSPFETILGMLHELRLDEKIFFSRYQYLFQEKMKEEWYERSHVVSLLSMLSTLDELYGDYLSGFISNKSSQTVWNRFVNLSETIEMNELTQKHLIRILTQNIQHVSIETFNGYLHSAKTCFNHMKRENQPYFAKIIESVIFALLHRQLNNMHPSSCISKESLRKLLGITLELTLDKKALNQPCLFMIQHLLFKQDKYTTPKWRQIKNVFDQIKELDQKLCDQQNPSDIIQDSWLDAHVFSISHDLLKWSTFDYESLCKSHLNHPWSTYLWSRLVNLSFCRAEISKPRETLEALNKWFTNMKHNDYDESDTLTMNLVKSIFEALLSKYAKDALSFSNIDSIMQYILILRERAPDQLDVKLVDGFVEAIKQSIKDVLLLNSKAT